MRHVALIRTAAAALSLAFLAPVAAHAQRSGQRPVPVRDPGDKTAGEEEEIEKREEWFRESRSLDSVNRPDQLRATAVADLALRQAQRAEELRMLGQSWQPIGPYSMTMLNWVMGPVAGRAIALAVHPTNDDILYLGTASGGLWKTTNAGGNWTSIFDGIGTLSVGAVALQPGNPNVVWAGTGERQSSCAGQGGGQTYFGMGIFRSTDAGATFQARNGTGPLTLDLSYIQSIAMHPTDPNTLVVAGEAFCLPDGTRVGGGVFKTTDAGATWIRVKSGTGSDVLYDPTNPAVMYLSMNGEGIFKSTDGGNTWGVQPVLVNTFPRIRLAMAPSDPQSLYALAGLNSSPPIGHLFRTSTGGATWTQVNTNACEGQCTYDLVLDIHPSDPNTLIVGTVRFATSFNGGTTLTPVTTTWGGSQAVHQDTHIVKYSRTQPGRYWVGGDGGLWRTDSSGFDFINMNSNLNLTQFYDIAIHPDDPSKVWGGAQDNSSSRRDGSQQWNTTVVTGDGFMNLVDPADTSLVFQTSYPATGAAVYRSLSGGIPNTFNRLPTAGMATNEPFPWVTPLAVLPGTIFVGSNYVYRGLTSTAQSAFKWTKISPDLGNGQSLGVIHTYGTPKRPNPRAYTPAGAFTGSWSGRIWRSTDVLAQVPVWTDVTNNYPGGYVSDIATDPLDVERVYVTRGAFNLSRLYRSTNGGLTWDGNVTGLPNIPANTVAVDPTDGRRVFVGNDIGVYESTDYGATFQPFSLGLPLGVVVTDLEIDDSPYTLVAGTYGRGAWRVDLVPVPNAPPDAEFAESSTGLAVGFQDRSSDSDGKVVSWLWSFGDGTTSTLRNPVKSFVAPGAYSVTLTVTDDHAASSSTTTEVVVSGAARRRRR
jgi:photosystem II stability/assembly factor-like uncharacterized protein